jgi:N-glycosylase/DNA lyase
MPEGINASDFDLAATLECGQAFRWQRGPDGWFSGVVGQRVLRIRQIDSFLEGDVDPHYFALDIALRDVVATFPVDDELLRAAVQKHWGLRVLRQEPWETLASFIASSTKQIVQIRQIVAELSCRFGEPLDNGYHAFPLVADIARLSHKELWDCKLGFRAKNLLAAARMIDGGKVDLHPLPAMEYERALEELMKLPGVGEKIANCVLLFSCGFEQAFPVDVWIERALRRLYFPHRKVTARQLCDFARGHFGPYAGWAQQYLFFNERTNGPGKRSSICE